MSRRERHFQDTEEKQQDKITKKKKESEFKKSPQKEDLREWKGVALPKEKKRSRYSYKYRWIHL